MRPASIMLKCIAAMAYLALCGCGIIPMSGPASPDVRMDRSPTMAYEVVKLDQNVIHVLANFEPNILAGAFTDQRRPSGILFGIGDVVNVTIFEAAAGGLFIPIEAGVRPGNFVNLPAQTVDNDGNISVPYAGTIRAAGRTNLQVQNDIVDRIKNRAIEPQAVVALAEQRTSLVSVIGDVRAPLRFATPPAGALDKITDAITRAGGISGQGWETWVMLERNGQRKTIPFANLIYMPKNNIFVQPGDHIYVYREAMKFLAFGATGQQGEFNFDAWQINLAQAVAKAGGLFDIQADPGSIFLYRREPREVAVQLGIDCSKYPGDLIPIVFSVSFQDPAGFFLATKLQMRPFDVLYVANAPQVDATKFMVLLNTMMGTATNEVLLHNDIVTLIRNIRQLKKGN